MGEVAGAKVASVAMVAMGADRRQEQKIIRSRTKASGRVSLNSPEGVAQPQRRDISFGTKHSRSDRWRTHGSSGTQRHSLRRRSLPTPRTTATTCSTSSWTWPRSTPMTTRHGDCPTCSSASPTRPAPERARSTPRPRRVAAPGTPSGRQSPVSATRPPSPTTSAEPSSPRLTGSSSSPAPRPCGSRTTSTISAPRATSATSSSPLGTTTASLSRCGPSGGERRHPPPLGGGRRPAPRLDRAAAGRRTRPGQGHRGRLLLRARRHPAAGLRRRAHRRRRTGAPRSRARPVHLELDEDVLTILRTILATGVRVRLVPAPAGRSAGRGAGASARGPEPACQPCIVATRPASSTLGLTLRQLEVLTAVATGAGNRDIADELLPDPTHGGRARRGDPRAARHSLTRRGRSQGDRRGRAAAVGRPGLRPLARADPGAPTA